MKRGWPSASTSFTCRAEIVSKLCTTPVSAAEVLALKWRATNATAMAPVARHNAFTHATERDCDVMTKISLAGKLGTP